MAERWGVWEGTPEDWDGRESLEIVEDPYPDIGDNPYFVSGGVSTVGWYNPVVLPHWMEPTIERVPEPPEPWTCRYCGTLNPGDVWSCTRCPAPRQEVSKREQSVWQPPVRVVSHEEPTTTPGLDWVIRHPDGGVLRDKPSPPWWVVFLCLALAILAFVSSIQFLRTMLDSVIGMSDAGSFGTALLWLLISTVCCILWKNGIEPMYNWRAND